MKLPNTILFLILKQVEPSILFKKLYKFLGPHATIRFLPQNKLLNELKLAFDFHLDNTCHGSLYCSLYSVVLNPNEFIVNSLREVKYSTSGLSNISYYYDSYRYLMGITKTKILNLTIIKNSIEYNIDNYNKNGYSTEEKKVQIHYDNFQKDNEIEISWNFIDFFFKNNFKFNFNENADNSYDGIDFLFNNEYQNWMRITDSIYLNINRKDPNFNQICYYNGTKSHNYTKFFKMYQEELDFYEFIEYMK